MYDYFKALHIIFIVTWFAGLFYLPRLFIYYVESEEHPNQQVAEALKEQFKIMQKRLWYGITWPSCILAIAFGSSMLHQWLPLADNPWLVVKLGLVFLLFLYLNIVCQTYKHLYHQLYIPFLLLYLKFWCI